MQKVKILNLYACLGGNRYKWDQIKGLSIEVTAIELDQQLAKLYKERFPNDRVIVADAHKYLLENFKQYDFIWSSPPCPTHSRIRMSQRRRESFVDKYADMSLYQQVILLDNFFDGLYCVENVIPYYKPLIAAQKIDRHLYWCNFNLKGIKGRKAPSNIIERGDIKELSKWHDYDFYNYKGEQSRAKVARNLVDYEVGKKILERAYNIKEAKIVNQYSMF